MNASMLNILGYLKERKELFGPSALFYGVHSIRRNISNDLTNNTVARYMTRLRKLGYVEFERNTLGEHKYRLTEAGNDAYMKESGTD